MPSIVTAVLVTTALVTATSLAEPAAARAPSTNPGNATEKPSIGGVVAINPRTNRIVRKLAMLRPNVVALASTTAWVTDNVRNVMWIWRVDPLPRRPRRAIRVGPPRTMIPNDMAVGGGSLWMLRGTDLLRYDARTGRRRSTVVLPPGGLIAAVAYDAGAVWTLDATRGWISRISPRTNRLTGRLKLNDSKSAMAARGGSIWVSSGAAGIVEQVTEKTLRVRRVVRIPGAGQIAADETGAWVVSTSRGMVARIDGHSGTVRWLRIGGATSIATTGSTVWVVASAARRLLRVDAARFRIVARIALPRRPYWVAARAGRVWVTYLGRNFPSEAGDFGA
jgi:DNA-binding beta-propeller fold protein YncE